MDLHYLYSGKCRIDTDHSVIVDVEANRPILVLDEWAADQNPETRQRFYEEILPGLRAEGCSIFAITHDEQYFHMCDRRLHMIEGRLVPGVTG